MRAVLLLWLLVQPSLMGSQPPPPAPPNAIQQPEPHATKGKKDSHSNQQPTPEATPLVSVRPALTSQPEAAIEADERRYYTSAEWWLVYVTGALCAITLGLAIFTLRLWRATKNLVNGADETAQRQLRAYVFAVSGRIEDAFSATGGRVVVTFHNSGQTPAYDCTVRYDLRFLSSTDPCPTDEPTRLGQSRGDIAPGAGKDMSITFPPFDSIQRSDLEKVGVGGVILYVFGRIQYTDAFKESRRQSFCYAFGGIYGSSGTGGLAEAWHGHANDAN